MFFFFYRVRAFYLFIRVGKRFFFFYPRAKRQGWFRKVLRASLSRVRLKPNAAGVLYRGVDFELPRSKVVLGKKKKKGQITILEKR